MNSINCIVNHYTSNNLYCNYCNSIVEYHKYKYYQWIFLELKQYLNLNSKMYKYNNVNKL